jgi:hypothetical protein
MPLLIATGTRALRAAVTKTSCFAADFVDAGIAAAMPCATARAAENAITANPV